MELQYNHCRSQHVRTEFRGQVLVATDGHPVAQYQNAGGAPTLPEGTVTSPMVMTTQRS